MIAKTATSEYLLLFRSTSWQRGISQEEIQQNLERFTAWFKQLRNDGKFKGGAPLVYDGKIVRVKRDRSAKRGQEGSGEGYVRVKRDRSAKRGQQGSGEGYDPLAKTKKQMSG
jgi:hypothetical protein